MPYTYAGRWGPETFWDEDENLLTDEAFYVYLRGTTTLATLYTDRTKTTSAVNPDTTDENGNGSFFADPGEYDVLCNDVTLEVTVPIDPVEAVQDADLSGYVPKSLVTTKGDLLVATASGTITRLPVGSSEQVLTATPSDPTGLAWATGGGGGGGAPVGATYITATADGTLTAEKVLGTDIVMAGLLAARPAASLAGRLYFATDDQGGTLYRDTGSAWVQIGAPLLGAGTTAPQVGESGIYQMLAAVIRNNGAPDYWDFIDNADHHPIGFVDCVSDTSKIRLTYSATALKVLTLVACPDETMARRGFFVGASVGTAFADISISQARSTLQGYITSVGADQTVSGGWGLPPGCTFVSFASGILTFTHPACDTTAMRVEAYDNIDGSGFLIPAIERTQGDTTTSKLCWYDPTTGNRATGNGLKYRCFFERPYLTLPAATNPQLVGLNPENIWIYGFNKIA